MFGSGLKNTQIRACYGFILPKEICKNHQEWEKSV